MRSWPVPPRARTIHCVGDTQGVSAPRRATVLADLADGRVPDVAHRVQVGDFTVGGQPAHFAETKQFLDAMGSGQWWAVVGNHDLDAGLTAPQAAAAIGCPSLSYSVDLGYAVLVFFYVRAWLLSDPETPPDTAWLDVELAKFAGRTVIIVSHPGLRGTTGIFEMDPADDAACKAVLAAHPAVKAWVCGHSHLPYWQPRMVSQITIGTHEVVNIDCGALLYTVPAIDWIDPLWTVYLTVNPDELQVRFRDHAARQWIGTGATQARCLSFAL